MMCRIAQESVALYATLKVDGAPGWYGVGGIEVATTEARMRSCSDGSGSRAPTGSRGRGALTPAETAEAIPLLDPRRSWGLPRALDGIAKAVRIATALARGAQANGAAFEGGVAVTGFDVRDGACTVFGRTGAMSSASASALRRDLGPDGRRIRRRPGPAGRGPAPAGLDRSDPRARG